MKSFESDTRYRVLRLLGRGATSEVYLAVDTHLNRRVALKMLAERHLDDEATVRRFRQEALAAAELVTTHSVTVYDTGDLDGVPYLAMEVATHGALQDVLEQGPVDAGAAVAHTRQILTGLAQVHALGIVHRDIKPQNVLAFGDGRLKLSDFGIARSAFSEMTDVEPGTIVGTAAYLSPEQASGDVATPASDIYATGVVLYALLTGEPPFGGGSDLAIARSHRYDLPDRPSTRMAALDPALEEVLLRALEKDPRDRYASAEEFNDALAPFAAQTSPALPRVLAAVRGAVEAPTMIVRRNGRISRTRVALAAVGTALAIAGVALLSLDFQQEPATAAAPSEQVPALANLHLDAAQYALEDSSFRVVIVERPSKRASEGYVLAQRPAPGASAPLGSELTLIVSSGFPRVRMPDTIGRTGDEALALLDARGLRGELVKVISSSSKGSIVEQNEKAGTQLLEGTKVKLKVSDGPHLVRVPTLVGLTAPAARQLAAKRKLSLSIAEVPSSEPAGTVVAQSARADTQLRERSTIRVNVSTGVPLRVVPSVRGVDVPSAIRLLRDAGFGVRVTERIVTKQYRDGLVLEQAAASGSNLPQGSVVDVVVGRYIYPPGETATSEDEG